MSSLHSPIFTHQTKFPSPPPDWRALEKERTRRFRRLVRGFVVSCSTAHLWDSHQPPATSHQLKHKHTNFLKITRRSHSKFFKTSRFKDNDISLHEEHVRSLSFSPDSPTRRTRTSALVQWLIRSRRALLCASHFKTIIKFDQVLEDLCVAIDKIS